MHSYRCCKCRGRNMFPKAVRNWLPVRGLVYTEKDRRRQVKAAGGGFCRHCGHTSFYVDQERMSRRACYCAGYHHAHRPGSPMCHDNPWADLFRARAAGCDEQTLADIREYVASKGVSKPAPF
jgi:hypothetical protein